MNDDDNSEIVALDSTLQLFTDHPDLIDMDSVGDEWINNDDSQVCDVYGDGAGGYEVVLAFVNTPAGRARFYDVRVRSRKATNIIPEVTGDLLLKISGCDAAQLTALREYLSH